MSEYKIIQIMCPNCKGGTHKTDNKTCSTCKGLGVLTKKIKVKDEYIKDRLKYKNN
jgi:DnaJ-class molecular chaperone